MGNALKALGVVAVMMMAPLVSQAHAAAPDLSAVPTSVAFGTWNTLNDVGPLIAVTLKAEGSEDVSISNIELTGPGKASFYLTGTQNCQPVLAASTQCGLSVGFAYHGSSPGEKVAAVEVTSDDADSPLVIPVTGNVEITRVTISPPSQDFGEAEIAGTGARPQRTFTVSSIGSKPFDLGDPYLAYDDEDSFRIKGDTCPASINPGQTCEITTEFDPAAGGPGIRTTRLNMPQGISPAYSILTGTATAAIEYPKLRWPDLRIKLKPSAKKVKRGSWVTVGVTLTNRGNVAAGNVVLRTVVHKDLAHRPEKSRLGSIAPGETVKKTLRVKVRRSARKGKLLWMRVETRTSSFKEGILLSRGMFRIR